MHRQENDMPRTAYRYTRLSTAEQLKGQGKDRQTDGTIGLCQRKGWTVATEVFTDDGKSAFSGENLTNGDLGRFFSLVKAGTIKPGSVLVCESLDRLIRPDNMAPALRLWSAFLDAKVSVATVIGEQFFDAFDPHFASVLVALAEMDRGGNESRTKSARLKAWWAKAREEKKHTKPPAWLKHKTDTDWPERPERVAIVKNIFRLAREGVSIDRIAVHLNQTKVPPMGHKGKNNKAKQWNAGYIYRILTNKSVIGTFTPHVGKKALEPIKGYYPAIISEDEFYTVQNILSQRRKATGPRSQGAPTNLFTGLVKDAWDGSAMSVAQKGAEHKDKMIVSYAAACGQEGSRYIGVRYKEVETAILRSLHELEPNNLISTPEGNSLPALQARIDEITEGLEQIKQRLAKKTTATLLDTAEQLEEEREGLRKQVETVKAQSAGSLSDHLEDTKGIITLLSEANSKERIALRDKLKASIGLLVQEVWLYVFAEGKRARTKWPQKWWYGQVYLRNGMMYEVGGKQGDYVLYTTTRQKALDLDLRSFPKDQEDSIKATLVTVLGTYPAISNELETEPGWFCEMLNDELQKV